MAATDKQKQSLYFSEDMLREIMRESTRLDRSLSWTVQHAWRLARDEVRKFSSVDHRGEAKQEQRATPVQQSANAPQRHPSTQVREFLRNKFDRELTS
jgi:uncharacterized small protein (TIGR04563 family)